MTVTSMLRTLRERWLLLVAGVLVGLLAAGAVAFFTPRTYAATTSLFVSAADGSAGALSAYQGSLLSQQRVTSYAQLVVSERVLAPVAADLTPGRAPTDLADDVAVTTATNSTIMSITVEDLDPSRAAALADAVAARFTAVVGELEASRVPGQPPAISVNVVDRATAPTDPERPSIPVDLVVGFVVGLVGGAALALVRGTLDTTLRDAAELARLAGGAPLGALPEAGDTPLSDAGYGEAVRRVRTNLQFADVDRPHKLITVTSAVAGEGKTTLVCALAAAFGRAGRVAVVEGDLRRPTIADRLGLVGDVGLTDVLGRRARLSDAMQRWGGTGVDVLVCGSLPPDPTDLLSSGQMGEVLTLLHAEYDLVLLDAPPLLPVADAAVLASRSDGALLVARAGATTGTQVAAAVEALGTVGARVVGSVLSHAPARRGDPAGYDGYRATALGIGGAPAGSTPSRAAASPAGQRGQQGQQPAAPRAAAQAAARTAAQAADRGARPERAGTQAPSTPAPSTQAPGAARRSGPPSVPPAGSRSTPHPAHPTGQQRAEQPRRRPEGAVPAGEAHSGETSFAEAREVREVREVPRDVERELARKAERSRSLVQVSARPTAGGAAPARAPQAADDGSGTIGTPPPAS
ncbi:tyrosine-protein kinase domain-containing protein [Actinomycetospora sp. C-140]